MPIIESYAVFDIETTGLPWEENNQTKITEISFITTTKSDIEKTALGNLPPYKQLTLVFNPCRPISQGAVNLTGLTNKLLLNAPTFEQKIKTIISFFEKLPKPICLIAHNGKSFDFRILLSDFNDAGASLPEDLLCVDSLAIFRKLLNKSNINYYTLLRLEKRNDDKFMCEEELLTDDDASASASARKRPKLNKTNEYLEEIEGIHLIEKTETGRQSFTLKSLYKRLLNKDVIQKHRSRDDSLMLLECIVAMKNDFLQYANVHSHFLTYIKPIRYNTKTNSSHFLFLL